ncbi:hypothetical protein [Flavobacterium sp.]|jgi:hypothetical protein|uniref:hypothetical protein n=1 Tax=Flavobacterium sp. TaxID=239 RepID=UPI001B791D38|nr:hypothetical protein [Flavobacterium sp.]MBP6128271.1 hypothetical protein [Flavobacterium sp.]
MCVLKVYSDDNSFKSFATTTNIFVYSTYEKGDYKNEIKKIVREDYGISFNVSDREWDDLKGQIEDTILFLEKHFKELEILLSTHKISDAYLDFPIYSRLDENIVNQNDHLPKELIVLAGKLSLGIEMAIYSKEAFE